MNWDELITAAAEAGFLRFHRSGIAILDAEPASGEQTPEQREATAV